MGGLDRPSGRLCITTPIGQWPAWASPFDPKHQQCGNRSNQLQSTTKVRARFFKVALRISLRGFLLSLPCRPSWRPCCSSNWLAALLVVCFLRKPAKPLQQQEERYQRKAGNDQVATAIAMLWRELILNWVALQRRPYENTPEGSDRKRKGNYDGVRALSNLFRSLYKGRRKPNQNTCHAFCVTTPTRPEMPTQ